MMDYNKGFSLIEGMIMVAIMGIFAAVALPYAISYNIEQKKVFEDHSLSDIEQSLRLSIKGSYIIPGITAAAGVMSGVTSPAWNVAVSKYSDMSSASILQTSTGTTRLYVYPSDFMGVASSLPYNQAEATFGNVLPLVLPLDPRLMIISGITKQVLIAGSATGGSLTPAIFSAIWNQSPAALIKESKDIRIQRINTSNMFKKVVMDNLDPVNISGYKINGSPVAPINIPTLTTSTVFVIDTSPVQLYDSAGAMSFAPYANNDLFYYFNTAWSNSIAGNTVGGGTGGGGGGSVASLFNQTANGSPLSSWTPKAGCSPVGTFYGLTIVNNSASDMNVFVGVSGIMTFLKKVKTGRTWTGSVEECQLVTITPQDNRPAGLHIFYMGHAAQSINVI